MHCFTLTKSVFTVKVIFQESFSFDVIIYRLLSCLVMQARFILSVFLSTSCVVWVVIDMAYLSTLSSTITVEVMLILAPWGGACRGN